MTNSRDDRPRTADDEYDPEYVGTHSGADGNCANVVPDGDSVAFCGSEATHTVVYKDQTGLHETEVCDDHGEPKDVTDWRRAWSADVDGDRLFETPTDTDSDPDSDSDSEDDADADSGADPGAEPDAEGGETDEDSAPDETTGGGVVTPETSLSDVATDWDGIGKGTIEKLARNDIETLADLEEATVEDISNLHQIGGKMAHTLKDHGESVATTADESGADDDADDGEAGDVDEGDGDDGVGLSEALSDASETVTDGGATTQSSQPEAVDIDAPGAGLDEDRDDSQPPYLPDGVTIDEVRALADEKTYLSDVADELGLDDVGKARALTVRLDVYEHLREGGERYGRGGGSDD